jgi:hypothetical protein
MKLHTGLAIQHLTSAVFDNGRRGNPRPGCDCEQCFGYCLVDSDEAARATFERRPVVTRDSAELSFD